MDELKLMTFRLGATDVSILDALRDKFGLRSRADALRYAMRRTAEAEGVEAGQPKAKPKRRKAALPHKGQRPGGEIPGRLSLAHNPITSRSTEEHHDVYRIPAARSRDRAQGPARPASRRRIKAATPADTGSRDDLHLLLRDLRDVAASNAPAATPGSLMLESLRVLDGARTTIAAMADAPAELATVTPADRADAMREPLLLALDVLSELEHAVSAVESDDVIVESRGAARAQALAHKLAAVRAAVSGLSGHLREAASKLTDEPAGASVVRHALALAADPLDRL